ncbi:MAG: hypothetical protein ACRBG0_14430 [Lewinella sp.]|uniref:hypothetical protein n=1 Tax=Lewinella sp. TaxID=2004506 RepID=UPI003D6BA26C
MQHNSRKKNLLYAVYLLLLLLPCLEIALLILGYRPYRQVDFKIESTPDHCLIPHASLGFALHPGTFQVTINEGLTYTATHGADSIRIAGYEKQEELPAIWFLGCSYTYGMGIDDSLTFPFLVNKNSPQFDVKNFGVPGYGTVQSYLQLKQQLAIHPPPAWAIVNYADFHDERNALTPAYRRDLFMGYQRSNDAVSTLMRTAAVPYVVASVVPGKQVRFCPWDSIYHNWQYRETFAAVNFLQDLSDQKQSQRIDKAEVNRYIFQRIKTLCDLHGVRLLVTGITPSSETKETLKELNTLGLKTLDISVDLALEEYRNAPYDDHPNAKANAVFAKRITDFISNQ